MRKNNNIIMNLRGITLWCVWLCLSEVSWGAVKQYKFDVQYMYGEPDCVEQVVIGINGHFPGPTITAEEGDTLHIILTNNLLREGTVLHWHGIRQYGTPWADGTASISQCAIAPGQTFHYRFTVDRAGTYFYHGHYGLQRTAGLYGSLIVNLAKGKKEAFHYDGELNLLLSDWWHQTTLEQEVGLSSIPFRWVNEPQSLLINGRGQYNCSLAANVMKTSLSECKFKGNEECAPQIFDVDPNKTYRIRIASATSLASLNLAIGKHKLVVVEADGNYVKPFTVDDIDIYSGETYSVLLRTNQDPKKNYWISIGVRGRKPNTPQGLTILNYKTNSATLLLPTSPPPITPQWDDYNRSKTFTYNIFGLKGTQKPPKYYDRRLLLLNTQNLVRGYTKWAINNVSLTLPSIPYLASVKFNVNGSFDTKIPPNTFSEGYDIYNPPLNPNANTGSGVYMFQLNQVVDVILQNANVMKGQNSEIHPWHLHGHDFWVLGYGDGKFQQSDERKFNLKNPPLRNNVVVFPYGWTALRFRADNPGVWAFHCHIQPHLYMGMGVVFAEALLNVKRIPNQALACGLLRNVSIHKKHN